MLYMYATIYIYFAISYIFMKKRICLLLSNEDSQLLEKLSNETYRKKSNLVSYLLNEHVLKNQYKGKSENDTEYH